MLLLTETFDNTERGSYENLKLGYSDDYRFSGQIIEGAGRGGSKGFVPYGTSSRDWGLTVSSLAPSKRLIFGGYFKLPVSRNHSYINERYTIHFYFCYRQGHSILEHFRVTVNISDHGKARIDFFTANDYAFEEYPKIESQDGFVDVLNGYILVEVYVDLTDAEAVMGRAKVALNGVTFADITNIRTGDINKWDNGGSSDNAFLNSLCVTVGKVDCLLDSLYICNEALSYHDDFLGPYDISTLRGCADGDQANWERMENGETVQDDDRGNWEFVTKPVFDKENAEFMSVTASQSLVRDLAIFDTSNIPIGTQILAVNHKLQAKGLAIELFKYPGIVSPIVLPSGGAISYQPDYEKTVLPFLYSELNATYDVHPALTTPWTLEFLENSQFGYCFFETETIDIAAGRDGYLLDGREGDEPTSITDNDLETGISPYPEVVISLPAKNNISHFQFVIGQSHSEVALLMVSPDGTRWSEVPRSSTQKEPIGIDWGEGIARNQVTYLNPYPGLEISHVKVKGPQSSYATPNLFDMKVFAFAKVGL
ncbi:MAG: hypothetical protein JEZ12_13050 [Desulfobacterium sp.]|nr:hypothetical protein [Desulfobacterium sp.]